MKRNYLLALWLCMFSSVSWAAADFSVDHLVAEYQEKYDFSGVLFAVKNGQVMVSQAVGYANDAELEPITVNTRIDIGSIQKDLTAVLVFQAIDSDRLKLSDKLGAFSLGFSDPRTKDITIQQLLEHRSGFEDIFTAEYRANPSQYDSLEKKLALLQKQPLRFDPGTDRRYSNYGYIVLGIILEKVTGTDYWDLIEQNILLPAREGGASAERGSADNNFARLYHFNFEGSRVEVAPNAMESPSPGGGGMMSVLELYGFYQQLFGTKALLSETSLQAFRSMQRDQEQWLSFGGGKGVSAAAELDFAKDTWVFVLANIDRLVAEKLSSRLRSFLINGDYPEVKRPAEIYAYQFYQEHGAERFIRDFESNYKEAGYQTFMGRTLTNLARELVSSDKARASIFFFDYLVRRFPEASEVHDGLAFGYFSAGDVEKAQQSFAKATALQPGYQSQFSSTNYEMSGQ